MVVEAGGISHGLGQMSVSFVSEVGNGELGETDGAGAKLCSACPLYDALAAHGETHARRDINDVSAR